MTHAPPPRSRTRERPPRAPKPEERPLDDGRIDGPEVWRTVDDVTFCHWDRWLLRLALADKHGLAGLAWLLRDRVTDPNRVCDKNDAEALHLQMADLQKRLAGVGRTPETLLDDDERASVWLLRKAERRVWRSGPLCRTQVMRDTPRKQLSRRARRGNWSAFPVSPATYEATLRRALGDLWSSWNPRAIDIPERVAMVVDEAATASLEHRLAMHRAAITVLVEARGHIDDSWSDVTMYYAEVERAYLDELRAFPARARLLQDLVEFVTWEDYGLTRGADEFLTTLDARDADAALRAMRRLAIDLRRAFGVSRQIARLKELHARIPTGRSG